MLLFLAASRNKYPGGVALRAFHDHVSGSASGDGCVLRAFYVHTLVFYPITNTTYLIKLYIQHSAPIRLHIGVAAAETGVSRFGERAPASSPQQSPILYSKAEGLPLATRVSDFDYVIVEPDEAAEAVAV